MRLRRTWVATFNGAACRVYAFDGAPRALEEVADGAFDGARKPAHRDRPTRVFSSTDERRSASEPRQDAERALEDDFVAGVARFLDEAAEADRFDDLVVAAAPRALGAFRNVASKPLLKRLVREIDGDYVNADAAHLLATLQPR